jgi:hypothetical protein
MKKWLLLCLLVPLVAHAEIYRWVDEAGNVVYSDQPHKGATKVQLPGVSTYQSPVSPGAAAGAGATTKKQANQSGATDYGVTIVKPADNGTVRNNNGDVDIQVTVEPPLNWQAGQRLAVSLDSDSGQSTATSSHFQLRNVDRGTHALHVWVVGANGQQLSPKSTITFFMHRAIAKPQTTPPSNGNGNGSPYTPPSSTGAYTPPSSTGAYTPPANGNTYKPPANGGAYKPPAGGNSYKPNYKP